MIARDRILSALKAAGPEGVAYSDLLRLAGAKAIAKALLEGRKAGLWCSNGRKNDLTRYYLDPAHMRVAVEFARAAARTAKAARNNALARARRAEKAKARPVKVREPKERPMQARKQPKAIQQAQNLRKPARAALTLEKLMHPAPWWTVLEAEKPKKANPFKDAQPTNPRNVKPVALPGCQVERFKPTGEERFFSSLAVGNYLRSDSALARAYAQGGAL